MDAEGIIEKLFEMKLRKAASEGDLWWQVRALEELDWESELRVVITI